MKTIELSGISYVTAREIEDYYKLTHKKVWQVLKLANLPYEKAFNFHIYKADESEAYFNAFILEFPKYNKINYAK